MSISVSPFTPSQHFPDRSKMPERQQSPLPFSSDGGGHLDFDRVSIWQSIPSNPFLQEHSPFSQSPLAATTYNIITHCNHPASYLSSLCKHRNQRHHFGVVFWTAWLENRFLENRIVRRRVFRCQGICKLRHPRFLPLSSGDMSEISLV